jgi:hypothetical protein
MTDLVPFDGATPQQILAQLEASGNLSVGGLILPPDLTLDQYESIGALLYTWGEGWRWAVGDWLIQGHGIFGDEFYQVTEILGLSVRSRQQMMRVSERIPPGPRRRVPTLRWSHHRAVASLEPEEADSWLQKAIEQKWTKAQLEDNVKHRVPEAPPLAFQPTGYVVERVLSVAERVYASATVSEDPDFYLVERRLIHDLADALGASREDAEPSDA